jgi:hypothetical protein
MRRLPVVAALVVLGLAMLSGVQAVNVFAAMQTPAAVGGCGSSGDVRTTAACYRIGRSVAWLQSHRWPHRSASWRVTCPPDGGCPFTMTFRRAGFAAIRCSGTAVVTGDSGDWRQRPVALSYRC